MNYIIHKPGDDNYKTYSLEGLRVAVASGEVQLDWQVRNNGKETTVRQALSTCYECGKEINSLDVACPACGAPLRSSSGSTTGTASPALDFHVSRKGKHFGPYTELAARSYLADGRINADDLCWRPGMTNWMPASEVLREEQVQAAHQPDLATKSIRVATPRSSDKVYATSGMTPNESGNRAVESYGALSGNESSRRCAAK